ncbi:MAG: hypothetical protein CHACPFDD_01540 [Phycisphaerae bacterium]|nr:hypothetical protein [Phycisphaerae bacterium]
MMARRPIASEGRREPAWFRATMFVVLVAGALPIIFPLYWLLLASLKTHDRLSVAPPDWLPVTPCYYLRIDDAELPVTIIDDGENAGTGVARVRLAHDAGARLRIPAQSLHRSTQTELFADVDRTRRRVSRETALPERGPVEVRVVDAFERRDVPAADVTVVEELAVFWSALGVDLPVTCTPSPPPREGHVKIAWADAPPAQVDARRLNRGDASGPMTIEWRGHTLAVELLSDNSAAGIATIRLRPPAEALTVPAGDLRIERRFRRFAEIDGRRSELRVVGRDESRGVANVELLDAPRSVTLDARAVQRVTRELVSAGVLGQTVEVRVAGSAQPDEHGRLECEAQGMIAVAADRIRVEAPLRPQWHNYAIAWREQNFAGYVANTLFIAAAVVIGNVLSCGLVGYAFARLEFRGRDALFLMLLATMMIPGQVTSIPTFVLFAKLGWLDTYKPLIVPQLLAQSAFFVFLFRQFMLTIPNDLEDSARIDGCNPLATWWLIMMPLSRPIVVTVAVFAFMGTWNDLLGPLLYINSDAKQTVALGLQNFKSAFYGGETSELLMAASVLMIVPSILLFFVAQRAFIRGVVVTGVKG